MWNKARECMEREEIEAYQFCKLKETVDRVYHNVEVYRDKMQQIGLIPEDIERLKDIEAMPFTTKQDLRDSYPNGLFAVPMSEIIRIHRLPAQRVNLR